MTAPVQSPAWVFFEVGGVPCEGEAHHVAPAGGVVPEGWREAWLYEPVTDSERIREAADAGDLWALVRVLVSSEDCVRIVGEGRLDDTPAAHQEALWEHISVVEAEVTRRVLLSRRGLRGCLPREFVQYALATPAQWAKVSGSSGDISIESFVRAGGLPEFGISPGQFQEWLFLQANGFDEAWAEELKQEKAKATAPYRRYLEQEPLAVPSTSVVHQAH